MRAHLISQSLGSPDIFEISTLAKANSGIEPSEQSEIGIPVSSCCDEMSVPLTVTHGHSICIYVPLEGHRNLQVNCGIMARRRRQSRKARAASGARGGAALGSGSKLDGPSRPRRIYLFCLSVTFM